MLKDKGRINFYATISKRAENPIPFLNKGDRGVAPFLRVVSGFAGMRRFFDEAGRDVYFLFMGTEILMTKEEQEEVQGFSEAAPVSSIDSPPHGRMKRRFRSPAFEKALDAVENMEKRKE